MLTHYSGVGLLTVHYHSRNNSDIAEFRSERSQVLQLYKMQQSSHYVHRFARHNSVYDNALRKVTLKRCQKLFVNNE